jgi:DnaK suppressor protein
VKPAVRSGAAARATPEVAPRKPAKPPAKKKAPARAARAARGATARKAPARGTRPAARPGATAARRPATAARPVVKKGAPARPAVRGASAKVKGSVKGKSAPRSAGMKRRPQAAKSTKAPGAGRKPAR